MKKILKTSLIFGLLIVFTLSSNLIYASEVKKPKKVTYSINEYECELPLEHPLN